MTVRSEQKIQEHREKRRLNIERKRYIRYLKGKGRRRKREEALPSLFKKIAEEMIKEEKL